MEVKERFREAIRRHLNASREGFMSMFRRHLNAHEQMNGTGLGSINSAENGSQRDVQKALKYIREGFMNTFRMHLNASREAFKDLFVKAIKVFMDMYRSE